MNKVYIFVSFLFYINTSSAQTVNIPDANFKNYLLSNSLINTNLDGEIQTTEANSFTGTIFAENKNIGDLTGIQDFTNLTNLQCWSNQLTTLNLTSNIKLEELACGGNQLISLNLSNNPLLKKIHAVLNQINTININGLNVLEELNLENNQLTTINTSDNDSLWSLNLENNLITSLDLSNCAKLKTLALENNSLTSLDLSNNTLFTIAILKNNNLNSLNIANGNNTALSIGLQTTGNPNLTCIEVDDVVYANANFTNVDTWSSFSINCFVGINETKNSVIANIYPNPATSVFNVETTQINLSYQLINVTGKTVAQGRLKKGKNSINIENTPTGVYFLTAYNQKVAVATQKLVITH